MITAGVATRKLTYEDLRYWPEDGKRHELIDGEHFVTPAPIPRHQFLVVQLVGWSARGSMIGTSGGSTWLRWTSSSAKATSSSPT